MDITIDVVDLVNIIRAAKMQNSFKVQEIVQDHILPQLRKGGDPAAAREVAGALTNEKRKLALWGVDLSRIENAWVQSGVGQAMAETGNGDKKYYFIERSDWSIHWGGGGHGKAFLEAMPQQALMRMAMLNWKPVPPLLSVIDVLAREVDSA
jgi:hypothetical protein